jgi:hypothetical protein
MSDDSEQVTTLIKELLTGRLGSDAFWKPLLLGFGCRGVRFGSGVSEVLEAFVTTLATVYGKHDDRALRLDRLLAGSSLHRFRYPR